MNDKRKWGKGVIIAHGVWGAIGFSICVLLVLAGGGHPPPLIFLPLVVAVWAVGHGAIWVTGRIAVRGRRSVREEGGGVIAWPLGLKLALILTGFASAIGIIQIVVTLLIGALYPFRLPGLWAITMVIWIAHGACFVGLLLRKRWSRWLCAALPLAWAALLAAQIVDHLVRGSPIDPTELVIVLVLILVLSLFGYYLARSKRVGAQFES
jgi:hypothetical protein